MDRRAHRPPSDEAVEHGHGVLDRIRALPVGTLDPDIIGDAGPTDVPPGYDPPDPVVVDTGLAADLPPVEP